MGFFFVSDNLYFVLGEQWSMGKFPDCMSTTHMQSVMWYWDRELTPCPGSMWVTTLFIHFWTGMWKVWKLTMLNK